MPLNVESIKAVVFDYGSTLIEFGPRQVMLCDMALAGVLEKHFGPPDRLKLRALRNRDRLAPYAGDPPPYKENDLVEITTNLVRKLYGVEPSQEQLADILVTRHEAFVRVVQAPPDVPPLLKKLRRRYRLGLLSNYPDAPALRGSLERTGLAALLDAVVISADVGLVKPHPAPFLAVLDALQVSPAEAVIVGDNWLGDIQGGKSVGLQTVLCVQWETPELFDKQPGDQEPDAVISRLAELEGLLL